MRRLNSSINETLCGDAAGHTNDRATKESLPRLGQRQNNVAATRRSSSADFLSLLERKKEESQHHTRRLHLFEKKDEDVMSEEGTDAQAGMPSQKLRRNMRSKIR